MKQTHREIINFEDWRDKGLFTEQEFNDRLYRARHEEDAYISRFLVSREQMEHILSTWLFLGYVDDATPHNIVYYSDFQPAIIEVTGAKN